MAFWGILSLLSWIAISFANPNFSINALDCSISFLYSVVTKIKFAFLLGWTFIFALTFLICVITSFKFSMKSLLVSYSTEVFTSGQSETIKSLSSGFTNLEYISDVINGINGCNNFKLFLST